MIWDDMIWYEMIWYHMRCTSVRKNWNVQTHNPLNKIYLGFNQNAQCYFRCLIFFHSKKTSWHIFCGKPGAMSLEPQLLSFSSILSNHSMLSVEALRLSRVCGKSWSCLSVLGLMGSLGKQHNGLKEWRFKEKSRQVQLFICIRGVCCFKMSNTTFTDYQIRKQTIV